ELAVADSGTTVPKVVGFTLDGARNALREKRLQVKEISRSSGDQASGTILDQDPAAESLVRLNTVVSIGVNALVQVPDLVNTNVTAAKNALKDANLTVGAQTTRMVDSGVTGKVISQNPGAKTWVVPRSAVQLETE